MTRFALALTLLSACFFDADYSHVHVRCPDGTCPGGMTCYASTGLCGFPDAAVAGDGAHDARQAALTCADPGDLLPSQMGSTVGHTNLLSTSCGGAIYNAPDAVYRIAGPGLVTIGIDSAVGLDAYVIGACSSFPTCEMNTAATPSAPLAITLSSGMHLVVVDGVTAGVTGSYTLTITR
jgi:hypothetical protein